VTAAANKNLGAEITTVPSLHLHTVMVRYLTFKTTDSITSAGSRSVIFSEVGDGRQKVEISFLLKGLRKKCNFF
jgi:hypothetical protein